MKRFTVIVDVVAILAIIHLPCSLGANPNDFMDNRYAQSLDQRGLYLELDRQFKPR